MQRFLILTVIAFLYLLLIAQDTSRQRDSDYRQFLQIREEINQLEAELERSENTLQTHLKSLENLDQQTTLQQKALRILQGEIKKSKAGISSLNSQVGDLNHQIADLKNTFTQQIVFTYKYQKGKEFEWLLGSENFNEALLRYRYFQKISESGRRLYQRLVDKENELQSLQAKRSRELAQQEQLLYEKENEQKELTLKSDKRQGIIHQITRNQALLAAALEEKRKSYEELANLIGSLETERSQRTLAPREQIDWSKVSGNFADQKKKLNWPIRGKIINKFGKYKNPRLKTVLLNNGIDIQANKGTEVHCVFSGAVSLITYMSGFGNTVIIDHNNGYYTVYAHFDEVFVKKFQIVDAGTVIGTVGDSGSLEGARLHFEIYGGNKPQNPLYWLKS
jgi:septal ring factor EnvC (AmiA/AmiB activator)